MAASVFAEFVGLGPVVISDVAAETARSLRASDSLVRIAAVTDLVCFISDMALAAAFYVVLRRTSRGLAAFAALLRTADAVILASSTVALFAALRLVSGAPYLRTFAPEQLDSLARLLFGVRADAMNIGWVLLGLGHLVFAWLWLKSRYVPRLLAAGGILASLLIAITPLAMMISPPLRETIGLSYMAPMFVYEVVLGTWLLARGIREPRL